MRTVPEPFIVKHYSEDQAPSLKGNGFDGLEVGDTREEAQAFVDWLNDRLMPDYRGYAHLGTGAYVLNCSDLGEPAELIISIASEEDRAGRVVGDLRDNPPGTVIQPEQMAVRLRFENVAGLDALEQQLRLLRAEHFGAANTPQPVDPCPQTR